MGKTDTVITRIPISRVVVGASRAVVVVSALGTAAVVLADKTDRI